MKEITSIAEARQQQLDEQARRDFIKGWIPRLRKEYEAVLIGFAADGEYQGSRKLP